MLKDERAICLDLSKGSDWSNYPRRQSNEGGAERSLALYKDKLWDHLSYRYQA